MRSLVRSVSMTLLFAILCATPLAAGTRTWNGGAGANTNWSNAANWQGGFAPAPGDDLVFAPPPNEPPSATRPIFVTNDFPAGTIFHSISTNADFQISGNEVRLDSGGLLIDCVQTVDRGGVNWSVLSLPITLEASQTWQFNCTSESPWIRIGSALDLNGMNLLLSGENGVPSWGYFGGPWFSPQAVVSGAGMISANAPLSVSFLGPNTTTAPLAVYAERLEIWGGTYPGPISYQGSGVVMLSGAVVGPVTVASGALEAQSGPGDNFTDGFDANSYTGDLVLMPGTQFGVYIYPPPDPSDRISVTGAVNITGVTLRVFVGESSSRTAVYPEGTQLVIIDNDGCDPVIGTFKDLPEGAIFHSEPERPSLPPPFPLFRVSYVGGDGNDVVLTVVPPAPVPFRDFNADGKSDILLQNSSGQIAQWQMNGVIVSSGSLIAELQSGWVPAATGDFSSDGKSDIVLRNSLTGAIAEWQMDGFGIFLGKVINPLGACDATQWNVAGTGDFNADGLSEIVLQNAQTGEIDEWQMNGTTIKSSRAIASPGASWTAGATGDFDGDGKSDIALQNSLTGEVAVWLMDGLNIRTGNYVAAPGTSWKVIASGDFDNDGKSDLVLQNADTGEVAVWLMDGISVKFGTVVETPGTAWKVVATGDFDGDHHSDILLQRNDGPVAVWLMNGTTITTADYVADPGPDWKVVAK